MPLCVGEPFPALSLPDLDGHARPLAEAWAQGDALIVLGHRNCKTTRETLPYVDRIHRRRQPRHGVVAVLQDGPDDARELRAELGLDLPVRLESDPYPLAGALGLTTVPTLFVVGRDGRIAAVCEAFRKPELQGFADRLGASPAPLFAAGDLMPALRPG